MTRSSRDALRYVGVLATLVVGVIHLQQYADFIADVPTIGALFALNGLGAAVVALMLATRYATLGALAGIALSTGALVSLFISMTGQGLFGYTEPTFRVAVVIAIVAEIAAVVVLLAYLALRRQPAPRRLNWTEQT